MKFLKLLSSLFLILLITGCYTYVEYYFLEHDPSDLFRSDYSTEQIEGLQKTSNGILTLRFQDLTNEGYFNINFYFIAPALDQELEIKNIRIQSDKFNQNFLVNETLKTHKQLYTMNYKKSPPERIYNEYYNDSYRISEIDAQKILEAADGTLKIIVTYFEPDLEDEKELIFDIEKKLYKTWNPPT